MKTTRYIPIMAAAAGLLLTASCVKNTLYNTPHPDYGKITVQADWSARGEGIDIPAAWRMSMADYTGSATGTTSSPDHLFEPGTYTLTAWNPTPEISVEGTTATVEAATGNWDGAGDFIHNAPTWFFTHAEQVTIEKDRDYTFTAAMRQQIGELTLVITPTGDAAERITELVAYLSGAAGTLDFATDTYGAPSNVVLPFTKITSGADAGKWTTTVRLLGVTGAEQSLKGEIRYLDDNPRYSVLDCDLTEVLKTFNAGKNRPLTLGGTLVETPDKMGFTLEINAWGDGSGGDGSMVLNCTFDAGTNTYTVYNEEGLRIWADAARNNLSTNCILGRNITMEAADPGASNWTPIGENDRNSYTGHFDGGNYSIAGLTIDLPEQLGVGMFGYIGQKGSVENLTLREVRITGKTHVGGVVGYTKGDLSGCSVSGSISGGKNIGGVAGYAGGKLENCASAADVTGSDNNVGGVVGWCYDGTLIACSATGNVSGVSNVGGVVGFNSNPSNPGGALVACFSTSSLMGTKTTSSIGGVAGSFSGPVTSCYHAIGSFPDQGYVESIVGNKNSLSVVSACYWSDYEGRAFGNTNATGDATKVDGTTVLWDDATLTRMNSAIETWNSEHPDTPCNWRYATTNPATPPTLIPAN